MNPINIIFSSRRYHHVCKTVELFSIWGCVSGFNKAAFSCSCILFRRSKNFPLIMLSFQRTSLQDVETTSLAKRCLQAAVKTKFSVHPIQKPERIQLKRLFWFSLLRLTKKKMIHQLFIFPPNLFLVIFNKLLKASKNIKGRLISV